MPARCFKDNCHILWSETTNEFGPAYEGTLRIDGDSSLFCDEPTGGLNVKVADFNVNGNILQRLPTGHLFAALNLAEHASPGPDTDTADAGTEPDIIGFATVPSDAASGSPAPAALDFTYVNDSGQEQLIVFRGQFQLHYDVLREGSPVAGSGSLLRSGDILTQDPAGAVPWRNLIPFNAQWIARLKRSLNGGVITPVIADHFSTSGLAPDNVTENTYKSEWRNFTWIEPVSNGGSIRFQGDIFHDGVDQTLNIATAPVQQLDANNANAPARGFRIANCDLHALPLRVA